MKTFKDLKVGDKLYYIDAPRNEISSYEITNISKTGGDFHFHVKQFISSWWVPQMFFDKYVFGSLFSDIDAVMKYINEDI